MCCPILPEHQPGALSKYHKSQSRKREHVHFMAENNALFFCFTVIMFGSVTMRSLGPFVRHIFQNSNDPEAILMSGVVVLFNEY